MLITLNKFERTGVKRLQKQHLKLYANGRNVINDYAMELELRDIYVAPYISSKHYSKLI